MYKVNKLTKMKLPSSSGLYGLNGQVKFKIHASVSQVIIQVYLGRNFCDTSLYYNTGLLVPCVGELLV